MIYIKGWRANIDATSSIAQEVTVKKWKKIVKMNITFIPIVSTRCYK